mgnify:CR=1 FL=1
MRPTSARTKIVILFSRGYRWLANRIDSKSRNSKVKLRTLLTYQVDEIESDIEDLNCINIHRFNKTLRLRNKKLFRLLF